MELSNGTHTATVDTQNVTIRFNDGPDHRLFSDDHLESVVAGLRSKGWSELASLVAVA